MNQLLYKQCTMISLLNSRYAKKEVNVDKNLLLLISSCRTWYIVYRELSVDVGDRSHCCTLH